MTAVVPGAGCPKCRAELPPEIWNLDYETYCPACRSAVQVTAFPALFRDGSGAAAEPALEGTEASCFFHTRKKAVVPCDQCGRFLCALCQVELCGRNWCPLCLESERVKGKLKPLEVRRVLYDNMALLLATAPALLVWPTIITAPMTLYMTVRYWRTPLRITRRTRVRVMVAGILALIEIGLWIALAIGLAVAISRR